MRSTKLIFLFALLPIFIFGQIPRITITDASINANDDIIWTNDQEYLLDGLVFVEDGATLTIEPGTVIYGKQTSGEVTSALIICRGAQIIADGNPSQPIIFTSELDYLGDAYDVTKRDRALWGGLILLGKAQINRTQEAYPGNPAGVPVGTRAQFYHVEGIDYDPVNPDTRTHYGHGDILTNPVDNDNSGILRYVSIRHGGFTLGDANEINGLTMGGVGSGTTIDYVEVYANDDDGFEWFGGTVNAKHLVSAFVDDDDFDTDEGYRGYGQFFFAIKDTLVGGGRAGEHDGGVSPNQNDPPFAASLFSNTTYIGNPDGAGDSFDDGGQFVIMRDNSYADYQNSIWHTDFPSHEFIDMEGDAALGQNDFKYGMVFNMTLTPENGARGGDLTTGNDFGVDPQLISVSWNAGALDPRPAVGSPAASGANFTGLPSFFTSVNYRGAFEPGLEPWYNGWSALSQEFDHGENVSCNLRQGWDLIGAPVDVPDRRISSLYPNRVGFFGWSGTQYTSPSSISGVSEGYWLNNNTAETKVYRGATILLADVNVPQAGWRLVSGVSAPVPVSSILDPQGIFTGSIFGWSGTQYVSTSTLEGCKGYWMNFSGPGTIRIQIQAGATLPKESPEMFISNTSIKIEDATGNTRELYLNVAVDETAKLRFSLPPLPPAGFDARFAGDYYVSESNSGVIHVMADAYPVKLTSKEAFTAEVNGQSHVVEPGKSFEINNTIKSLRIIAAIANDITLVPEKFEVFQNYPNPFNPETQISFNLPQTSQVEVFIFNALGQRIKTLVSNSLEAGFHNFTWNSTDDQGNAVSSGVYYYSVKSGANQATYKMLLVK